MTAPVPPRPLALLLAEDDPGIARGLARLLARDGHRVDLAANGRLALAQLAARPYDAVLSDLRMPELDGPGLYREAVRRYPRLRGRVLFLTGDTLTPEVQTFLAEVGAPCLTKPFTSAAVRQALAELLQQA